MPFIIMGHRTAGSVLGPAKRPVKNEFGAIAEFAQREVADERCHDLNMALKTPNVHYTVQEATDAEIHAMTVGGQLRRI